jgi:hypothetical protein
MLPVSPSVQIELAAVTGFEARVESADNCLRKAELLTEQTNSNGTISHRETSCDGTQSLLPDAISIEILDTLALIGISATIAKKSLISDIGAS